MAPFQLDQRRRIPLRDPLEQVGVCNEGTL